MRYFSYNEPILGPDGELTGNNVVTVSEQWIRDEYYPIWLEQMVKKFGEEYVDKNYSFLDCLDEWIVVNWAWESTTKE